VKTFACIQELTVLETECKPTSINLRKEKYLVGKVVDSLDGLRSYRGFR